MNVIHSWGKLNADFISTFLKLLGQRCVHYFVLRNYEELPEHNNGKDVDIVIAPGSYRQTREILLEVMRKYDIHYYQITQFDKMHCWYIMDYKKNFGIHIDLIENEVYKGFEFFKFEWLYEQTERYKDFVVLNKPTDTLMLLVQNLVAYKSLKEKYRKTIKSNYSLYKREIDERILEFWGNNVGKNIVNLLNKSDFDAIVNYSATLERTAMRNVFLKRPIYTLKGIIRFLGGKFFRVIWCPKKLWRFIAVEAPDGTGKTTFIENLIIELRKYYVSDECRFCVHHFRPSILPNLGVIGEKAGVMKQDKDFTNPHRAKSANLFSSFFRMCYYWFDYLVGIPLVLRKEVQYERYTIFDRYIYDFLIDPKRSRINLPRWIRLLFTHFVIQPQIVFVLLANAEIIYKRKQELTKEEISRQLVEYKKLESLGKRVVFIDANQDIRTMANQAIEIIMNRFLDRV